MWLVGRLKPQFLLKCIIILNSQLRSVVSFHSWGLSLHGCCELKLTTRQWWDPLFPHPCTMSISYLLQITAYSPPCPFLPNPVQCILARRFHAPWWLLYGPSLTLFALSLSQGLQIKTASFLLQIQRWSKIYCLKNKPYHNWCSVWWMRSEVTLEQKYWLLFLFIRYYSFPLVNK